MASTRGVIIALIILGVGIYAIQRVGEYFLSQPGLPTQVNAFADLIKGMRGLTDTVLMGIGILVVLLIVVWIARRSSKKPVAAVVPSPSPTPLPEIPERSLVGPEEYAELPPEEKKHEER